jgi:hypothetical protein
MLLVLFNFKSGTALSFLEFVSKKRRSKMKKILCMLGVCLMVGAASAEILIQNNFDGVANDIGPAFQVVDNGVGSGSADITTGVISVGPTGNNRNIGFNNVSTVDVTAVSGATGFTIEWVVDSFSGNTSDIAFNGWFFGVTANTTATGTGGTALWVNDPDAVGITIIGGASYNDMSFVEETDNKTETSLGVAAPTFASLADGFTISMTVNDDNTWSAFSTGLSADFNSSGTITRAGALYANIADNLSAYTSMQGPATANTVSYTVGSVTLSTIPEPATIGMLGLGALITLLVRRWQRS